jgi:hypothetical protein
MLYPATPALEVDAVQLKETLLEVMVPAARLAGTIGALVPEPDWLPPPQPLTSKSIIHNVNPNLELRHFI